MSNPRLLALAAAIVGVVLIVHRDRLLRRAGEVAAVVLPRPPGRLDASPRQARHRRARARARGVRVRVVPTGPRKVEAGEPAS